MSPLYVPALQPANNLSDVASATTARGNLALDGVWRPQDHGLIGWSFDPAAAPSTSQPASGTVFAIRIKLALAASITNIHLVVATGGATLTAGDSLVGLYQGGSLIGQTADQSGSWISTGEKKMALSGGPFAVTSGDILIAGYSVGTTIPLFRAGIAGTIGGNINLTTATARFATADTGRTTTLPNPLGALSFGQTIWGGVS